MVQALCKTYEEVSVSYEVKHIPAFDPVIPFLNIYPEKLKCQNVLAAFFLIDIREQENGEIVDKQWCS